MTAREFRDKYYYWFDFQLYTDKTCNFGVSYADFAEDYHRYKMEEELEEIREMLRDEDLELIAERI